MYTPEFLHVRLHSNQRATHQYILAACLIVLLRWLVIHCYLDMIFKTLDVFIGAEFLVFTQVHLCGTFIMYS